MCQAYPFPTGPAHLEALLEAQRSSSPPKPKYACPGCGGTLFGNLNENCPRCVAASTVPPLLPFGTAEFMTAQHIENAAAQLDQAGPVDFGNGGDFAGGGATGSFGD